MQRLAAEYLVDGRGRRVGKKVGGTLVASYLWDGDLRVVNLVDGNGTARFVYGTKIVSVQPIAQAARPSA
ncbi:MAG TPA: hypothetical protein VF316_12525 [Polyangiaceae bacterium]